MKGRPDHILSIKKATQVIEALDTHGSLGTRELSGILGMSKSTIHRIISTLKDTGWIVENPSTRKVQLGFKLFALGNNVVNRMGFRNILHKHMEELAEKTGENVNLGMLVMGTVVHVDKVESALPIKVDATVGSATTSYNTALGKVLLAEKSDKEIIDLFQGYQFQKTAKNTITSLEYLISEIHRVREQEFAEDNEEFADGMKCYAVAIGSFDGQTRYALSTSFLRYIYLEEPQKEKLLLDSLLRTKKELIKLNFKVSSH